MRLKTKLPAMKQNHLSKIARASLELVPVRFEFTHPTAHSVAVAGSFNAWDPTSKSMHDIGNGHWLRETTLEPGSYEYCLVVDGEWMPDPMAAERVPNPFGGMNSILNCLGTQKAKVRTAAKISKRTNPRR